MFSQKFLRDLHACNWTVVIPDEYDNYGFNGKNKEKFFKDYTKIKELEIIYNIYKNILNKKNML